MASPAEVIAELRKLHERAGRGRWIATDGNTDNETDRKESLDNIARELGYLRRFLVASGSMRGAPAAAEIQVQSDDPAVAALAQFAAAEARRLPAVVEFRRKALRGKLVQPAEVAGWVEQRGIAPGRPGPSTPLWISYPGPRHALSVRVRARSVLARLRDLATELAEAFRWSEAGAVAFVLSDYAPRIILARRSYRDGPNPPFTAHYVLDVHPSLSGRQVAKAYELVRGKTRGHLRARATGRRPWPTLAAFAASTNDGRPWREAMEAWNAGPARGRPSWSYPEHRVGTFIRDARAAYRNLVGSEIVWKSVGSRPASARRAHWTHTTAGRRPRSSS